MSRKQPARTREGDARGWLGPAASGGERLARIFQVGTEANATAQPRPAPSSVTIDLPHVPRANDRDHWLARCDQFAVYAGERLLGTVEGIRYRSRADRPDLIEVRGGLFRRRVLLVPVDEVESVFPDEEAILVSQACSGTTYRRRLRTRVRQLVATLRPVPR